MTRECLHDVSIASPFVRLYQIVESAKALNFQGVGKPREADRSGLTQLGILCSIHLSYGGVIERENIFVVSQLICYHLL